MCEASEQVRVGVEEQLQGCRVLGGGERSWSCSSDDEDDYCNYLMMMTLLKTTTMMIRLARNYLFVAGEFRRSHRSMGRQSGKSRNVNCISNIIYTYM